MTICLHPKAAQPMRISVSAKNSTFFNADSSLRFSSNITSAESPPLTTLASAVFHSLIFSRHFSLPEMIFLVHVYSLTPALECECCGTGACSLHVLSAWNGGC